MIFFNFYSFIQLIIVKNTKFYICRHINIINMSGKKEDLRVKITKQLLYDAMFDLLRDNRFENIKVTDICDKAEIHRTTFYKHFDNKYELLEYCILKLSEGFDEILGKYHYDNLNEFYEIIRNGYVTNIIEKDNLFIEILSNNKNGILMEKVYDVIINRVTENLKNNVSVDKLKGIPPEFIAQYYVAATFEVYRYWLEHPDFCTKEELIKYLDVLIFDSFD